MSNLEHIIAWLVPTASSSYADKATYMPENFFRSIDISSLLRLQSTNLDTIQSQRALQLSFDQPPKRPGRFVLGTDARACDIILPQATGVSPQHCSISFDEESRLVLHDSSEKGTQVWYGSESSGDHANHTWTLDDNGTEPAVVDIQGLRFQIVINNYPGRDSDAYASKIRNFRQLPSWARHLSSGRNSVSAAPILPLIAAEPLFRHILVKGVQADAPEDLYLWNVAKPWEPMTKAPVA